MNHKNGPRVRSQIGAGARGRKYRPERKRVKDVLDWIFEKWTHLLVALAVIAAIIGGWFFFYFGTTTDITAKVNDKARVCDGGKSGSCYYLIYTDHGTLKDTDSVLAGKFNSSDVYGEIVRGCTYKFTVRGVRIQITSSYQNIISNPIAVGACNPAVGNG